ncbi:hypothetical protein AAVH_41100, partial [Aphelenchoides avenae]
MTSLEDFPEEIRGNASENPRQIPVCLLAARGVFVLGSNSKTHQGPLIVADVNQAIALPSDVTRILGVLEKATNIREIVIGPESSLGGCYAKLLHALSRSTLSLRRIEATYDCPEILTSKGLETVNFPSRSVHKVSNLVSITRETDSRRSFLEDHQLRSFASEQPELVAATDEHQRTHRYRAVRQRVSSERGVLVGLHHGRSFCDPPVPKQLLL